MKRHVRFVEWLRASRTLLALVVVVVSSIPLLAEPAVALWDTGSPLANGHSVGERTGWKLVPSDLLALEADPPKASSDPGYYGRDYAFKGDAVVENSHFIAVFSAKDGRLTIHGKPESKVIAISALESKIQDAKITGYELIRNAGDEVVLKVTFGSSASGNSGKAGAEGARTFTFGKDEIVAIKASGESGIRVAGQIEYAIAPSFVGDDLIFSAAETATNSFPVPADQLLVGLLAGGNSEMVLTWPAGKQQVSVNVAAAGDKRSIESVDIQPGGEAIYVAVLAAPGIWHSQPLTASFLEKDVSIDWKRPFPAKWKTELYEGEVRTTYAFREGKRQIWRGVAGSYIYPVWFNGDQPYYRLSKKVPPKGESLIYFLEGQNTPSSMTTPADIVRAALGRSAADSLLDAAGRKLRTHHRRAGDGVRRACTCGCTEAIQSVFEHGEEQGQKPFVEGCVDDMIFFVENHVARIDEYQRFAGDLAKYLQDQRRSSPQLKDFIDNLEQLVQRIPQEYSVQKENMKSLDYATALKAQTVSLAATTGTNNLKAYMELLKAWRGMGGAQDYVVALCHVITRQLAQEAGYGCVNEPQAVSIAREVRARCRQVLRNADGYEIWANY